MARQKEKKNSGALEINFDNPNMDSFPVDEKPTTKTELIQNIQETPDEDPDAFVVDEF